MNRCGSFPLLSAPHTIFSIWTNLKRYEKFPGAPTRRWGEWIWLTGPSGLHRNSAQGLNITSITVFDQIRDPEIPITVRFTKLQLLKFKSELCKLLQTNPYLKHLWKIVYVQTSIAYIWPIFQLNYNPITSFTLSGMFGSFLLLILLYSYHLYFYLYLYSSSSSSSECYAQGQVLHFKCRNEGCSSAEGRSPPQLRNQGCSLPGIE